MSDESTRSQRTAASLGGVSVLRWPRSVQGRATACGVHGASTRTRALSRRTGERSEAQEHLTTASTMYREMGMGFWLEAALKGIG